MKKEYAEKKHEHPFMIVALSSCIILIIVLSISTVMDENKIYNLEEEIASMPHYECWNESFKGFINKSEIDDICWHIGPIGEEVKSCNARYNGFDAKCEVPNGLCYVDDTKEVCKLNRHDVFEVADE